MNMETIKHKGEQMIPEYLTISRWDIVWYSAALCMSIGCAVISGIFFGQREAQQLHAKERTVMIKEFSRVTEEKDNQISNLSDVIVKTQNAHLASMNKLSETDYFIEKFIIEQSKNLGLDSPSLRELEAHVKATEVNRQVSH